jgi:hypothetical protein
LLSATFYYNSTTFGSVWRSGYNYWVSIPCDFISLTFGLRYLTANLGTLFDHSGFLFLALACAGLFFLLRQRQPAAVNTVLTPTALFLGLGVLPGVALHLFFFYSATRFFVPLFVILSALAGSLAGLLVAERLKSIIWLPGLLVLVCVLSALLRSYPQATRRTAADEIVELAPKQATVISALDPLYLGFFLKRAGKDVTLLPVSRRVEYASKLVMTQPISALNPLPSNPLASRDPRLLAIGAKEAVLHTADEVIGQIELDLNEKTYILDQSFLTSEEQDLFSRRFRLEQVAGATHLYHLRQLRS